MLYNKTNDRVEAIRKYISNSVVKKLTCLHFCGEQINIKNHSVSTLVEQTLKCFMVTKILA